MFLPEERNEQIVDQDGVDIAKLKAGTKLEVQTRNTLYKITILNPQKQKIEIQGGQIEEPEEAILQGSTWGGSMLKLHWVGYMMHMEIYRAQHIGAMVTTGVRSLKVIGPDWEYDFDWEKRNGKNEEA